MDEQQTEIQEALKFLSSHYLDKRANNKRYVGNTEDKPEVISGLRYNRTGMKQSKFAFVIFENCIFRNVALTGSQFHSVGFHSSPLTGNSFACCDFYDVDIDGKGCMPFSSNNLSLSTFELCKFSDLTFVSSGILNSTFHNCGFTNVVYRSSTLEGSRFINCHFVDCDFGAVNIEFSQFSKASLERVSFPFYQFPYVIGAADIINDDACTISIRIGRRTLPLSEYKTQLQNLVYYFKDKYEYFPMCNLSIAQGKMEEAQEYLLDGISAALQSRDFRMIRYFCQLALQHRMLNGFTRYRILSEMDQFLQRKDIPETQLNYFMTYVGSIRTMLHSAEADSIELHFDIKTNVQRQNGEGVRYVNTLMSELNHELSQRLGQNGYQLAVSNYSPFEIALTVLSAVGSAASIASLVWMTIDEVKERKERHNLTQIDKDAYLDYVDARIENLRLDLLHIQQIYSKKKFSKYIDEVTQQLKTDLEDLYSKDIMIFKVKNTP